MKQKEQNAERLLLKIFTVIHNGIKAQYRLTEILHVHVQAHQYFFISDFVTVCCMVITPV